MIVQYMDILLVFLELMTSSASQRLNILCINFKIMTFNIAAHLWVDVRIGILLAYGKHWHDHFI
jgi:hypothetical protein